MLQTAIVSLLISVSQLCPSPPVISLNGYANVTVNCKAPYVELGATAWSVCDGDLSPRIRIDSSQVNTNLPGEYFVYYDVTDNGGQAAAQVTRRVIVEDNFALTLNGFNFVTEGMGGEDIYVTYWECNRPYDDFGATAWDECDGNLTQSIIVEGAENVLPRELGDNFTINYSVTNSRGETLTAQRYVVIVDFLEPTVSLYGPGQSPARIIYDADEPDPQWWASALAGYDLQYPVGDPRRLFDLYPRWRIYDEDGLVGGYPPHYWYCDRPGYEDPGSFTFDECEGPLDSDDILMILIVYDPDPNRWFFVWTGFAGDTQNPPPPLANGSIYRMFYISVDSSGNPPWGLGTQLFRFRSIRSRHIQTSYAVALVSTGGGAIQDVTISCNTPFDPAADVIALSTCEGDITPRITIADGGLDVAKPGSYRIRYDVVDNYGWLTYAQRDVNVVDGSRPVITLLGEDGKPTSATTIIPWCALRDQGTEWWREYPDEDQSNWYVMRPGEGWLVTDNCTDDDMLTDRVQMYGQQELRDALEMLPSIREQSNEGEGVPIDPDQYLATYRLSHNVNDGSGESTSQAIPAYRFVQVVPTTPRIELKLDPNTTLECGDVLGDLDSLIDLSDIPEEAGVEGCICDPASDPPILTITGSVNTAVVGEYTVTYNSTNALGVSLDEPVVLKVTVEDTKVPEITIKAKPGYDITPALDWETGEPFDWTTVATVTAEDKCAGVLDVELESNGGMNFSDPAQGLYRLVFVATDPEGNSGRGTLTVNVNAEYIDRYPEISLLGEAEVTLECFGVFNEPGATAYDEVDGDLTDEIRYGGDVVNTSIPGTYIHTYSVTNSLGNSDSASRIIEVEDRVAPIMSLRPPAAMTVEQYGRFIDPGASADDNCDGNLPVIVTGAVNTRVAGVYTLAYSATDSSGNPAAPLTRVVRVLSGGGGSEGEVAEGEVTEGEGEDVEGEIECCDDNGCCGRSGDKSLPGYLDRLLGDYLLVGLCMIMLGAWKFVQ